MSSDLVELTEDSHDIFIDMPYADERNFTGKPVYNQAKVLLHKDAEVKLQKAIEQARNIGLKFIIYDAYRPPKAQFIFWDHSPNPDFLANPHKRGSPHSRGVAVDVGLADIVTGEPLEMGTPFDSFLPESWHANYNVSIEAQRNRLILAGIMLNAGFDNYSHEWWHYQFFNSYEYPLLEDERLGVIEP